MLLTQPQDDVLIIAIAGGDQRALATLYERYAGLMMAVGMRILSQRKEVEDLLHDVFLEAWRHAGDYDAKRGTVRTWLTLRMRSRALDRRRSARMTRMVLLEDTRTLMDRPSADDPALAPDRSAVRNAIMELPEEQRQVVLLSYFRGLSSSEIAKQVGVPIGTVKSRVAGARKKLQALLTARDGKGGS